MRPGRPPGSPWIESNLHHLPPPPARVLDLACGKGRHALLFLDHGYEVIAVDNDAHALTFLEERAKDAIARGQLTVLKHDIEASLSVSSPLGINARHFAAVVMVNYLHRPVLPSLLELLQPGGILLCETWAVGNEIFADPKDCRALTERSLRANELLELVLPSCEVLGFAHGTLKGYEGRDCAKQMIAARLLQRKEQARQHEGSSPEQALAALLFRGDAVTKHASLLAWPDFGRKQLKCEFAAPLDLGFDICKLLALLKCYSPGSGNQLDSARMHVLGAEAAMQLTLEEAATQKSDAEKSPQQLWSVSLVRQLPSQKGDGTLETETVNDAAELKSFFDSLDAETAEDFQERGCGWTVIANQVQGSSPRLLEFQHHLFCCTGLSGGLNAYLTPAGAIGKPPHVDEHDVIVMQLGGEKLWSLLDSSTKDLVEEVHLHKGDVLYLPKGIPHHARSLATGEPSLHLSIGLHRSSLSMAAVLASVLTVRALGLKPGSALPAAFVQQLDNLSLGFSAFGGHRHWVNQLIPARFHLTLVSALDPEDLPDDFDVTEFASELSTSLQKLAELVRNGPTPISGDGLRLAQHRALQQGSVLDCQEDLELAAALPWQELRDLGFQAFWALRERVIDRHFGYFGARPMAVPRSSPCTENGALLSRWQRPHGKVAALLRPGSLLRINGYRLSCSKGDSAFPALQFCLRSFQGAGGRPFSLTEVPAGDRHSAELAVRCLVRCGALEQIA
eukprot:TRINITY_DN39347_c0_g1_i1.p1 TRINITY_DN39347_c0_g1~~TRINITY_DN39347_c0_g1_i1.p1  ORF type:complete len:734 (+),score=141.15 TRINITY_DN39347_c0_g1_i1:59-2260(+)